MPRVYELPTHLQVDDALLLGLTARQLVRLAVGASLAYELWDVSAGLPAGVRIGLTAVLVISGLLLALLQPGNRPLDQWVLAFILFCVLPRRRRWRLTASSTRGPADRTGWAELMVHPEWLDNGTDRSAALRSTETERALP
jgi:hypothetical protein